MQILHHKRLTVAVSLVVFVVLSAGVMRVEFENTGFRSHLSDDDLRLVILEGLEDSYAVSDSVIVVVAPDEGSIFTSKVLSAIEQLTEQLSQIPYVSRVESIANFSHSEGIEGELIVYKLIEHAAFAGKREIKRIEKIALDAEEVAGRLVSRDGRSSALYVSFALPDDDYHSAKVEVVDALYATIYRFRDRFYATDFHLTGELLLNRAVHDALIDELTILVPISLIVMFIASAVALRSIAATMTLVAMLIAVISMTIGFAGWCGLKFISDGGIAIFVVAAITVVHSVRIITGVLDKLEGGHEYTEAIVESLQLNVWPVFLTSLTIAAGFVSLNLFKVPAFDVLANVAAFGSIIAFVYSVTLLPVMLSVIRLQAKPWGEKTSDIFRRFGRLVVSNRSAVLYASSAVIAALLAGTSRIEPDEHHLKALDDRYEYRQSVDFASEKFTGLEIFEYSLSAGRDGGVTNSQYLLQVEAFANWYRQQPEVVHVFGITDIIKRLNKNINGDNLEHYAIPNDSDLIAQYLLLYEFSLPVGVDLKNLIDVSRSATRMTIVVRALSTRKLLSLDRRAQRWLTKNAPDLTMGTTGATIVNAHSTKRNFALMLVGMITAMAIVSFILALIFKSVRFGLISTVPNFLPVSIALGFWGYVAGDIGVAAALVTIVAFGFIVDNTVHFMIKYLRSNRVGMMPAESIQSAFNSMGRASATTTLIFALGFLVFSASGITNNQELALLMVLTLVITLLVDFLFFPPLLMLLDRVKRKTKKTAVG